MMPLRRDDAALSASLLRSGIDSDWTTPARGGRGLRKWGAHRPLVAKLEAGRPDRLCPASLQHCGGL
jgi:hypothetical protein